MELGFLSCTRGNDVNMRYKTKNCHFFIQSKTGRHIVNFARSAYRDEDEVTFLPGTHFKLISIDRSDSGYTKIYMEEI
jgi:hypothetical protein